MRNCVFLSLLGLFLSLGVARAAGPNPNTEAVELVRGQVEKANARVEKLRQGYAAGAVSKRELEDAEADARDLERRLQTLSELNSGSEPGPAEARRRVEWARYDSEKATAKAKKLAALYQEGVVSRNETEAAQESAAQAETYLHLNEELLRRIEEIAAMPKQPRPPRAAPPGSGLGDGGFSVAAFYRLQDDYFRRFHHALPISAFGPSETHEKMGFDHEGRVDVALNPDSAEGQWLILQLEARHIPFIAFRGAVAGKATGAHIHMGFPSPHAS